MLKSRDTREDIPLKYHQNIIKKHLYPLIVHNIRSPYYHLLLYKTRFMDRISIKPLLPEISARPVYSSQSSQLGRSQLR